jgi:hypothetical protein
MDKTSGRNFVIRFFPKHLAIGQKSSQTVIALEGKPISAYPFRLFLLSLDPNTREYRIDAVHPDRQSDWNKHSGL